MVSSIEIEYLEPKNEFRIGSVKNIAVPSNNKDDIKRVYPNSKKTESNADMLTQSFASMPEITPIVTPNVIPTLNDSGPVQISPIPVIQDSDLEKQPVNLDMNTVVAPEISSVENVDNSVSEVPSVEQVSAEVTQSFAPINNELNTNSSEINEVPQMPSFESSFKISDAPNIFDNPTSFNQTKNNVNDNSNIVNEPKQIKSNNVNEIKNLSNYESNINDDIITAEIAILENDIKHYEGLAENNRKKIELLKKQIKKEDNDVNLENTASNLFKNSGILDEEKVLGETPIPILKAA